MPRGFSRTRSPFSVDFSSSNTGTRPLSHLAGLAQLSRTGTDPYGGDALGVEDAAASIDPPLPADSKAIYFGYAGGGNIYPDPDRASTSIDGGVIFSNVPVGEYTITATKTGLQFSAPKIRCRAGVLVNVAPPNGIQQR